MPLPGHAVTLFVAKPPRAAPGATRDPAPGELGRRTPPLWALKPRRQALPRRAEHQSEQPGALPRLDATSCQGHDVLLTSSLAVMAEFLTTLVPGALMPDATGAPLSATRSRIVP